MVFFTRNECSLDFKKFAASLDLLVPKSPAGVPRRSVKGVRVPAESLKAALCTKAELLELSTQLLQIRN